MRLPTKEYEYWKALKLSGYHGVYVRLYHIKPKDERTPHIFLDSTFWNDDSKIDFSVTCISGEHTYDKIEDGLHQIFSFTRTSILRDLSAEDNIEEQLFGYLLDSDSFNRCQIQGKYVKNVSAYLNGIEYRTHISIHTEEDCSLDKYDEDHDAMLEYCRNELVNLLTEKGMHDFQMEVAPDFLSVNVTVLYNHKIHHINIHIFYSYIFDDWKDDVVDLVICYYKALCSFGAMYIRKYEEYLQEYGYYEIDSHSDGLGNIGITAYCRGNKYGVGISIENEAIPFDTMEGHDFEQFCADVLAKNGFERIKVTQGSGDQGVDIIAYKDDVKYGIQCKCYSSDIGNRAVQEVFAGKSYYQCHVGVVLTNRYFTKSAIELANRNGIILWNRDKLLKMVEKYNKHE